MPDPTPPPHLTAWAVRSLAGEPVSAVRVHNLQAVAHAGADAWGRAGRPQPVLATAEVFLRRRFARASASDALGADTVHYGSLSKAVLGSLAGLGGGGGGGEATTLRGALDAVWRALTGRGVLGGCAGEAGADAAFLDLRAVRFLSVTLTLPKASLLGRGASLTACAVFGLPPAGGPFVEACATTLRLHAVRVPTLVGVNANERLARQVVAADIELDKAFPAADVYTAVEEVAVKTMEEASFETLEALASQLANNVLRSFPPMLRGDEFSLPADWQVRVNLEKPTAVPFADCPSVELSLREDD